MEEMIIDQKCKNLVNLCLMKLIKSQPLLGSILLRMNFNQVEHLPNLSIAGVNLMTNELVYCPASITMIEANKEELEKVMELTLAHESLHIVNGTFVRKDNRNPRIWNFATDYEINWMLSDMGFNVIDIPIKILYNKKYHDERLYAEKIYTIIEKEIAGMGDVNGNLVEGENDD